MWYPSPLNSYKPFHMAKANKPDIDFAIVIIRFDTSFLVWLRTGANPADINWFQSHTGKKS